MVDDPSADVDVTGVPPPQANTTGTGVTTVSTQVCIRIDLPGATNESCPATGQDQAPVAAAPAPLPQDQRPDQTDLTGTCSQIGDSDHVFSDFNLVSKLSNGSRYANQQCAKACNYGVIMGVGFKTSEDITPPDQQPKDPKQYVLMTADAALAAASGSKNHEGY
jgi:hypothetical protein